LEKDSLGSLPISDDVYYGIQTERARCNFDISGTSLGQFPELILALAAIKKAAALANCELGTLERPIAGAICSATDEILARKMTDQFPVDIYQGGGGTSTNMNMNEVLANRANELLTGIKGYDRVHPNDHVNLGQSTNDVIPSAMILACHELGSRLIKQIDLLENALADKEGEFSDVVKIARTCLQDALPITLGQEFSGYRSFVSRQKNLLKKLRDQCTTLPLGATAVGTGIGAPTGYANAIFSHLSAITGLGLQQDENLFDALQNADLYMHISGALKRLAAGLSKMAADLRLLSSGPRAGFNEIELPAVQPGSSIMPGKINPVMPEMIIQVAYRVIGNDMVITMAVDGGELDLNIWESVITSSLTESFRLLTNGIAKFTNLCVAGIKANRDVCRDMAASSLALCTPLVSLLGYEKTSEIAKEAFKSGASIRDLVVRQGLLSDDRVDALLDPEKLTRNQT